MGDKSDKKDGKEGKKSKEQDQIREFAAAVGMEPDPQAEYRLVELLRKYNITVACAESCTGGLVSARIVNVPGASDVFKEGFITYSNKAKRRTLDVSKSTIRNEGAISEQAAKEMAVGAAMMADTDAAVSVTGNAGPTADEGKPVGLVFIGIYTGGKTRVIEYHFSGERNEIRQMAAEAALLTLEAAVLKDRDKKKDGKDSKDNKDNKDNKDKKDR